MSLRPNFGKWSGILLLFDIWCLTFVHSSVCWLTQNHYKAVLIKTYYSDRQTKGMINVEKCHELYRRWINQNWNIDHRFALSLIRTTFKQPEVSNTCDFPCYKFIKWMLKGTHFWSIMKWSNVIFSLYYTKYNAYTMTMIIRTHTSNSQSIKYVILVWSMGCLLHLF